MSSGIKFHPSMIRVCKIIEAELINESHYYFRMEKLVKKAKDIQRNSWEWDGQEKEYWINLGILDKNGVMTPLTRKSILAAYGRFMNPVF